MKPLIALFLALALSSCISVTWRRDTRFERPPPGALASLQAGECDLARCIEELGAPLYVWEHDGDGMALAYGWYESETKGIGIHVPVFERTATFDYDRIDANMRGCVLFFDAERKLQMVSRGRLRAITAELQRKRPTLLDEPR